VLNHHRRALRHPKELRRQRAHRRQTVPMGPSAHRHRKEALRESTVRMVRMVPMERVAQRAL
jgi:hypothetical protein